MNKIDKNLDFYNFVKYGNVSEENQEQKRPLRVEDIMSKNPFFLKEDDEISILEEVLELEKTRYVPVISKSEEVVGILTHRDFLTMAVSLKKENLNKKVKVAKLMKRETQTIGSNESLFAAAEKFYKNKIGSLLVVKDKRLVGIVTTFDLLKLFSQKDLFLNKI